MKTEQNSPAVAGPAERRVRPKFPTHLNCSYILPGKANPDGREQWMRERTHGCWCSAWKITDEGAWLIWRNGQWCKPKRGELRMTDREPPNAK